ncbi:MAG: transposase [Xanthomonadales bacterium]|nr:transposase [Xanthomonadales bacterium]
MGFDGVSRPVRRPCDLAGLAVIIPVTWFTLRTTRPPIATKRVCVDTRGSVVYRYKHPFRDGSTHVVLEPLDFIARLAALVPRPRLNLTRFHGVFAPNFKHHERIVPQRSNRTVESDKPTAPMSWMQRLKRVFAIDIETCPECGGKLRVIACIEDPPLIAKILGHVQRRETLSTNTPRAPPERFPEPTLF